MIPQIYFDQKQGSAMKGLSKHMLWNILAKLQLKLRPTKHSIVLTFVPQLLAFHQSEASKSVGLWDVTHIF